MKHSVTGLSKSQLKDRILRGCESGQIDLAREAHREFREQWPESESILNAEIQQRYGFKL